MIYTFRCKQCNETTEVEHSINEPHPTICVCGGKLRRVFNKPNVHYRGSGYYSTDKKLYEPSSDITDYYDDNEKPI